MTVTTQEEGCYLSEDMLPNIDHLVTEDDEPVDNLFSEKQQRLLVSSIYASWQPKYPDGSARLFIAASNVGLFASIHETAIVPDAFISMDVKAPNDLLKKQNHSYMFWEFGKPPDIVIEIVSKTKGGELNQKVQKYAKMRILYYAVYDPGSVYSSMPLTFFRLIGNEYEKIDFNFFKEIGIGLKLWEGEYEGVSATWLRWFDSENNLVMTGSEAKDHEQKLKEFEREQKEFEREQKEFERKQKEFEREQKLIEKERADKLAEKLRSMGIDPNMV